MDKKYCDHCGSEMSREEAHTTIMFVGNGVRIKLHKEQGTVDVCHICIYKIVQNGDLVCGSAALEQVFGFKRLRSRHEV